jgi:hypothetical protein
MSIIVYCECGRKIVAQDMMAGRSLKCLVCGKKVAIPTPKPGEPTEAEPPRPRSAAVADDEEEMEEEEGEEETPETTTAEIQIPSQLAWLLGMGRRVSIQVLIPNFSGGQLAGLIFGVAALLSLVACLIGTVSWWGQGTREAQAELVKLQESKLPATPDQLVASYMAPPASVETGKAWLHAVQPLTVPAFQSALLDLGRSGGEGYQIPPPALPWPAQEKAEKLLAQHPTALEELYAVARLGGAVCYPVNPSDLVAAQPSHLGALDLGCRLLALDAHVRARRQDAAGAAQSLHAMLAMACSLRYEPAVKSQAARAGFASLAYHVLVQLLPAVQFSSQDLHLLRQDLRALDYEGGLYRGLLGEEVAKIAIFQGTVPSAGIPKELEAVGHLLGVKREGDLAFYLQQMQLFVTASRQAWPLAIKEAHRIEEEAQATLNRSALASHRFAVSGCLVPATRKAFDATGCWIALRGAADAAIAIELFRREAGRLPRGLQEMTPRYLSQLPRDPFDGATLRYVIQPDRCLIYSVGANGVDDGGRTGPPGSDETTWPDAGLALPVKP